MNRKFCFLVLVLLVSSLLLSCTSFSKRDPISVVDDGGESQPPLLTSTATDPPRFTPTEEPTIEKPTPTPEPEPTATLTPTPSPTPLGGGSGQLLFNGLSIATDEISRGVYLHDLETKSSSMLFDGFSLEAVSSDGGQLLISQLDLSSGLGVGDLYIANMDASEITQLSSAFERGSMGALNAGWLNNSALIIFKERVDGVTQLFSYHPDGEITQITNSAVGVLSFQPVIVNGGIFWEEGYHSRSGSWSYGWKWIDLRTSETLDMRKYSNPIVSPDGKLIADNDFFEPRVIISDFYGTDPTVILLEDIISNFEDHYHYFVQNAFWLLDSQHLGLFISVCSPTCEPNRIIFLSADGQSVDEVGGDSFYLYGNSQWSPDGRQFVLGCDSGGHCLLDKDTLQIAGIPNLQPDDIDMITYITWLP